MSMLYQRFLKVLEKWPIDKTKTGRDLGEHLRKQINKFTETTSITKEETENLTKQVEALERLSNNIYYTKYPRTRQSTATGLTGEQCRQVLSTEFLQQLMESGRK